jgi:hypothetical protein
LVARSEGRSIILLKHCASLLACKSFSSSNASVHAKKTVEDVSSGRWLVLGTYSIDSTVGEIADASGFSLKILVRFLQKCLYNCKANAAIVARAEGIPTPRPTPSANLSELDRSLLLLVGVEVGVGVVVAGAKT